MPAEKVIAVLDDAAERERAVVPVAQPSETAAVLNMIERVAQNPQADIDKMIQLLDMRDRVMARQERVAFNGAMSLAQSEMRVVVADKDNSQTRSKYASYAALDHAVRPIYTKHGFSVTFDTDESPKPEHIRIVADVSCGAHERRYHIDMPADGKGAKGGDVMTKTHAVMSAASYGKRGLLILIFNIPVADKWDDDGNAAAGGSTETISDEQVATLRKAIEHFERDEARFCKVMKVSDLAEIPASRFEAAAEAIATGRAPK